MPAVEAVSGRFYGRSLMLQKSKAGRWELRFELRFERGCEEDELEPSTPGLGTEM